jgi:hypothetical protein
VKVLSESSNTTSISFHASFCLCVSQVFEFTRIFLPSTVAPHACRREGSCLPLSDIITISTKSLLTSRWLRRKQHRDDLSLVLRIARVSLVFSSSSATTAKSTYPPFLRRLFPTPQNALLSAALSTGIEFEPRRQFADM